MNNTAPVIAIVSLGCSKNTVDSERLLGLLAENGMLIGAGPADADVVLVNTCSFIEDARIETEQVLGEIAAEASGAVIATGCFSEHVARGADDKIFTLEDMPGVAAFVRFEAYDELPELIRELTGKSGEPSDLTFASAPRLATGSPATTYLKISEGCSNNCSYCSIPLIRGPLKSFPKENLIQEAREVVELGAKELCLIAQDTARYGADLYGSLALPELLAELSDIESLEWIRLLYLHPNHVSDELLQAMANQPKVCRYLDVPVQHAAGHIAKLMNRNYDSKMLTELFSRIRQALPGVSLRTTVLVGFPGETESDFEKLLLFIESMKFNHLGAFAYSPEEDTRAIELPNPVSPELAAARVHEVMQLQQKITFELLDERIGCNVRVMLEYPSDADDAGSEMWVARSECEAPEVDGNILVNVGSKAETELDAGSFLDVKITGRDGYDLLATI